MKCKSTIYFWEGSVGRLVQSIMMIDYKTNKLNFSIFFTEGRLELFDM